MVKKIVLKVVKQCVGTEGVDPQYVRAEILPEFFKHFWVRRMALDRRNYKQLVDTLDTTLYDAEFRVRSRFSSCLTYCMDYLR